MPASVALLRRGDFVPSFASERPQAAAVPESVAAGHSADVKEPAKQIEPGKAHAAGRAERRGGTAGFVLAVTLAVFWAGCAAAYLYGYAGPGGLLALSLQEMAFFAAAILLPPLLFVTAAWALARGAAMGRATHELSEKVRLLTTADETAARAATQLGRAVRRELDALNSGIDAAHQRLRALENVLQDQIAALDEAGARADVRGQSIASALATERTRLEAIGESLNDAAARAGQTLAAHTAGLQTSLNAAESTLGTKAVEAGEIFTTHIDALAAKLESASGVIDASAARAGERLGVHASTLQTALGDAEAALDAAIARHDARANDHASVLRAAITDIDAAFDRLSAQLADQTGQRSDALKATLATAEASLDQAGARASEHLAGRAAQLKTLIESAQATLQSAGQSLDKQAQDFRRAADSAAEAPQKAALELDKQAKAIEAVADAAMARAEFVLGRHERHRMQMGELLQKLRDEGAAFEAALTEQRSALETALSAMAPEARRFENLAANTGRQVEQIMEQTAARTNEIATALAGDAARLDQTGQSASVALEKLAATLRDAGESAHALLAEASENAKQKAHAMVGEAMAECEKLVRAADDLARQSHAVRDVLGDAVGDVQRHMAALPGIAQQEAQRVREMMKTETEEILDISARTISTLHARTAMRGIEQHVDGDAAGERGDQDGLLARARRLTQRTRRAKDTRPQKEDDGKGWDMSTLLAAVETSETRDKELNASSAAALGALEAALSDMALDLSAFDTGPAPGEDEWRRYLAGDRAVFARRLAGVIDSDAINRITNLYRENAPFRETSDNYMREFETLLARAKEGDGAGLLASSMLSSDTGKIYLALAYALGRLL